MISRRSCSELAYNTITFLFSQIQVPPHGQCGVWDEQDTTHQHAIQNGGQSFESRSLLLGVDLGGRLEERLGSNPASRKSGRG